MLKNLKGNHQDGKALLLGLVFLAIAAGIGYYIYTQNQAAPESLAAPPLLPVTTEPLQPQEPPVQAPVEGNETTSPSLISEKPAEETEALPEPGQSDEEAMQVAGQVLGESQAANYLVTEGLISKLVATIDALTADELPGNIIPIRSPDGQMQATSDGVSDEVNPETGLPDPLYVFDPVNFQRYTPQVEVFEAIDVDELVRNYRHYYPVLQQSYRELGYAEGEFEDRLLAVIDELLATPEPAHPVRLIKPEAFYEFADPELEALSAGQKILVRAGPSNTYRIKSKLREIREAIQTQRE